MSRHPEGVSGIQAGERKFDPQERGKTFGHLRLPKRKKVLRFCVFGNLRSLIWIFVLVFLRQHKNRKPPCETRKNAVEE